MNYLIKEHIWEQIFVILSGLPKIHLKDKSHLRLFIDAVFLMTDNNLKWRQLPKQYGNWFAIYQKFKRWSDKGIWEYLFSKVKTEPDLEHIFADSTIIRAHSCATGKNIENQALGRSCGGFSTKVHTLCDALGYPIHFKLTAGQIHDISSIYENTQHIPSKSVFIADKAFDCDYLINSFIAKGVEVVIPSKKNRLKPRKHDQALYKERHLIEVFFGKLKQFRRIAFRVDKLAQTFLSFIYFASMLIWLK